MALYKYNTSGVFSEIKEKPFKLERDIQRMFETNMSEIMGLEMIKSEFTIKDRRIDTLAFDPQSKAFVIIEYKRERNSSVIDQALGLEAWAEYRRTGYPELYPCIDNLSDCGVSSQRGMRRLSFPYTEAQNNKANYDLGVAELGGADNEATDLKWAKKN